MHRSREHIETSIRIIDKGFNRPGCYFITLGTRNGESLFGSIYRNRMILNDFGEIVRKEWIRTAQKHEQIKIDEFIVMPNHMHGIIILKGVSNDENGCGDISPYAPATSEISQNHVPARTKPGTPRSKFVSVIIGKFKSSVTRQICHRNGIPGGKIWQENYDKHAIQSRSELENVREYIRNTPGNWWQNERRPRIYTDLYG